MKTRQGETEKRTSEKSAQVKPIKIDKQVAAWMKHNSNLKKWRHRVRPEHSIYTTLLGKKLPELHYAIEINTVYDIYRNITYGRVWETEESLLWGLCAFLWNLEIQAKTVSLMAKSWEFAGLLYINNLSWLYFVDTYH